MMSNNPLFRRDIKKIGNTGRIAEKKTSQRLKGKLTAASGASGQKGDINLASKDYNFMIEVKSSINSSISIQSEWLCKLLDEAISAGKTPALTINFVTDEGRIRRMGSWVMVQEEVFKDLVRGGV